MTPVCVYFTIKCCKGLIIVFTLQVCAATVLDLAKAVQQGLGHGGGGRGCTRAPSPESGNSLSLRQVLQNWARKWGINTIDVLRQDTFAGLYCVEEDGLGGVLQRVTCSQLLELSNAYLGMCSYLGICRYVHVFLLPF